jgi:hypothetical protein
MAIELVIVQVRFFVVVPIKERREIGSVRYAKYFAFFKLLVHIPVSDNCVRTTCATT